MIFKTISVLISFLCVIPNNAEIPMAMFEDLAAHVKSLEQKLNKVEEKLETAQMELDEQKQINRMQEDELSAQRNLIESLQTLNSELKIKVDQMERQRERTEALKPDGKMPPDNLSNSDSGHHDLGDQREQKMRVVRQQDVKVAFSAYLNKDLASLGPGRIIQFGATHLNEGEAFNALTGIFTVPVDGVYLFSFACEDNRNHLIFADIIVDQEKYSEVQEGQDDGHAMGTNIVILRLNKTQSVWVAIDFGGKDELLQNTATTFSGVFLYP